MEQRSDRAQRDHVRRGEDRIEIDLPRDQRIDRGLGEFDLEMSRDDQRRIDRQPSLLERTQIALIPLDDLGRLDIAQERDPPSPQPFEMRRRAPAAAQILAADRRSEAHKSQFQSLMRNSYA